MDRVHLTRRGLRSAALAVVLTAFIWIASSVLLSPDRGLDLTDEGLYLLEASTPDPTAAWGTPYGWLTGHLFRAAGRDVATFRTFGATILGLASVWLALEALRSGWRFRPEPWGAGTMRGRSIALAGAVGGGLLGAALHYSGFLRTPSYNWVVVAGATVAMAGFLRMLAAADVGSRSGLVVGVGAASFGLFTTIVAKPTTPILFAPIALLVLWRRFGSRRAWRLMGLIVGASVGWVGAAVLVGLWPTAFVEVFLRAATNPTPSEVQTVLGATVALARAPFDALVEEPLVALLLPALLIPFLGTVPASASGRLARLARSTIISRSLLGIAGAALVAWILAPEVVPRAVASESPLVALVFEGRGILDSDFYVARLRSLILGAGLVAGGLAATLIGRRRAWQPTAVAGASLALLLPVVVIGQGPGVLLGGDPLPRFVRWESTTVLLAVVAVAWALHAPRDTPSGGRGVGPGDVAALLTLMAFFTGFGSGHLPYRQASLAAPLFIAAAVLLLAALPARVGRDWTVPVAAVALLLTTVNLADSRAMPYRGEAMDAQVVRTEVGTDGAVLLLDVQRSGLLTGLTAAATEAGWRPGTPLLGVTLWPSTLVWHLGGTTPTSIMPALRFQQDRFARTLDTMNVEEWDEAWLLVQGQSDAEARASALELVDGFASGIGTTFPADYEVVWTAPTGSGEYEDAELWRPRR